MISIRLITYLLLGLLVNTSISTKRLVGCNHIHHFSSKDKQEDSLSTVLNEIPEYVIKYAPIVHLYSEEKYLPCDVKTFVERFKLVYYSKSDNDVNTKVVLHDYGLDIKKDLKTNYKLFSTVGKNTTTLNIPSNEIFMEIDDFDADVTYPRFLLGNKPDSKGYIKNAPANLIVRKHTSNNSTDADEIIDAYWFFFYGFNLGAFVMGQGPWGNHIGDWEHCIIRFVNGTPQSIWLSAHAGGSGYRFEAIEKKEYYYNSKNNEHGEEIVKYERPVIFSAKGTHANYASVGQHAHDVPLFFSALSDFTDRGYMWDPALNFYGYLVEKQENSSNIEIFKPFRKRELLELGVDWLQYQGHWGNKRLPMSDSRQKLCPFQWRYIDGPTGPTGKNLFRDKVCQNYKFWNFWHGCPLRRSIKRGQGLDAERNDLVGDNCGIALYRIRPKWLRCLIRFLTWRGCFCFVMDFFTG
ncbi:uncharacterized protein SCDLUD_002365 [Saccharomycodes ludwigii]|uniref:uncharacterized protein n=1 Tax=Saccharomycodes ludwigii TaxID=36035 RepID=UPI001E82B391|nr:hypothetical protein SCDLUD_002365 [Saccharomycodes ludwigii]KAH3900905.1 hypothetical protein SCDLUD_002365 [Saccharomycodes ludwigii]